MIYIIPTSKTEHLANIIKKEKKIKIVFPEKNKEGKRYFPDGEIYVKIPEAEKMKKKRVVVLHSGSPEPNKGLFELEIILQILKDKKIKPDLFFSYFPYGQQDKSFEKGETSVAENLIKKLVNFYKVKKIYIIDPHFGKEKWLEKYPVKTISAVPLLIKKARKDLGENILFLSPDKGGKRRTGIKGAEKQRLNSFEVKIFSPRENMKGKTIGVLDDIIETGGTILRFCDFLKKSEAKKIIVLASHGVLISGVNKIAKKCSKLYLTNSLEHSGFQKNKKQATVDISKLISLELF